MLKWNNVQLLHRACHPLPSILLTRRNEEFTTAINILWSEDLCSEMTDGNLISFSWRIMHLSIHRYCYISFIEKDYMSECPSLFCRHCYTPFIEDACVWSLLPLPRRWNSRGNSQGTTPLLSFPWFSFHIALDFCGWPFCPIISPMQSLIQTLSKLSFALDWVSSCLPISPPEFLPASYLVLFELYSSYLTPWMWSLQNSYYFNVTYIER